MAKLFIIEEQNKEEPINEIVFAIDSDGNTSSLIKDRDGDFVIKDSYGYRTSLLNLPALEKALAQAKELGWY